MTGIVERFLQEQTRHLGDEIAIEVNEAGASFPACASPQPFLPRAGNQRLTGRISVGIRCHGDGQGVRYLTAQVSVIGTYMKLSTNVERGSEITANMLEPQRGDLNSLPRGTILDVGDAVGRIAARHLSAGSTLRRQDLAAETVVRQGEEVSVETQGPGFVVRRRGEAMQSGALGDRIRVRLSRREILTTVVSGPGRVMVD